MKARLNSADQIEINCPACGIHALNINPDRRPCWGFNGDFETPTLTPSILNRSGHYINNAQVGDCWCDFEKRTGEQPDFDCSICHSFVKDGMIEFLSDCTHEFAGQTVPLKDFNET